MAKKKKKTSKKTTEKKTTKTKSKAKAKTKTTKKAKVKPLSVIEFKIRNNLLTLEMKRDHAKKVGDATMVAEYESRIKIWKSKL
jgi:hypothetical protein